MLEMDGSGQAMGVELLPREALPEIAPLWQELEASLGGGGLTCSWDWTRTWLEHYADLVPHRFVVGERRGTAVAIALLADGVPRRRGPITIRSLHLGTTGEPPTETVYTEYNRLLVAPEDRQLFATALLAELRARRSAHELVLDAFAPEDAAPFAAQAGWERRAVSRTIDLDAARSSGGDVLAKLRSGTRQKIRRSLRGLGQLEVEWARTPEQALDILEELMELHQVRWTQTGMWGVFASPRVRAFHRALIPRLVPGGRAMLLRVSTTSRTLGCLYLLVDQRRALSYQMGVAPAEHNRLKPGMTIEWLAMQECLERGLHEYDLLLVDTRYKQEMATCERELVYLRCRLPWLMWPAIDLGRRARRALRTASVWLKPWR
jgi:CelD/BcsL family acetyltransferase involved in cellulose biosynthesis